MMYVTENLIDRLESLVAEQRSWLGFVVKFISWLHSNSKYAKKTKKKEATCLLIFLAFYVFLSFSRMSSEKDLEDQLFTSFSLSCVSREW